MARASPPGAISCLAPSRDGSNCAGGTPALRRAGHCLGNTGTPLTFLISTQLTRGWFARLFFDGKVDGTAGKVWLLG